MFRYSTRRSSAPCRGFTPSVFTSSPSLVPCVSAAPESPGTVGCRASRAWLASPAAAAQSDRPALDDSTRRSRPSSDRASPAPGSSASGRSSRADPTRTARGSARQGDLLRVHHFVSDRDELNGEDEEGDSHQTRGAGAAGISCGRPRRRRAYAAVNSTPYNRMTACT
jgi:hypothetical protein